MKFADFREKLAHYNIRSDGTANAISALSDAELKDIFGLPASATSEEVRFAHKKASIATHPDRNDSSEESKDIFQALGMIKTNSMVVLMEL